MTTSAMVVIGGGESGVAAALMLREQGHHGPIALVAGEVHLPYERPPLSKESLLAEEEPVPKAIASAGQLADARIDHLSGTAAMRFDRDSRTVALADGTILGYDKLLIATGARSRHLPLAGPPGGRVVYLRTHDEALHLRRALAPGQHMAVIGGGFIGLEVAASARRRGADVTVIEALPRVLSRVVPEEIADFIAARHQAEGVTLRCGTGVVAIAEDARSVALTLGDGSHLATDLLLVAIGASPETGLAEAAGLAVADGIVVDQTLRTSDPGIFAAGDCCSFPLPIYGGRRVRLECWRSARDLGALAARNMLGADEAVSGLPRFWSDQYDLTLHIIGLPDQGTATVRRDIGDGAFILFHLDDDGNLVGASGIGPGNAVARDVRIAEMLILKGVKPDVGVLSTPTSKLKALLAA
jgi:3-phenylpropionate/trans-cinnamate dioxygenase ferredoxin reductase subunit